MACEDCKTWKDAYSRLQKSVNRPKDIDSPEPMSADEIIKQLEFHRLTHSEWAGWFEDHPDDPSQKDIGTAEWHRGVEKTYDRMIAGMKLLKKAAADVQC